MRANPAVAGVDIRLINTKINVDFGVGRRGRLSLVVGNAPRVTHHYMGGGHLEIIFIFKKIVFGRKITSKYLQFHFYFPISPADV